MVNFCRLDLRTTDGEAARAFYAKIFGHDRSMIWTLHEEAVARGARPHWLGQLGVTDVDRAAAAFVERGATPLGPKRPTADGGQVAVLRDPGGAVIAVATPPTDMANVFVDAVWHVLNTNDATQAIIDYQELFAWKVRDPVAVPGQGVLHPFAWQAGGPSVGAIIDITGMPDRHPHWLFFFPVESVESVMTATRAAGGLALGPMTLPSGERICVCDDPQGAAFGAMERRRSA